MNANNLNAEDAFGLTLHGTTKTIDGREWAVYCDGTYSHVVSLAHWIDSGFADVPDEEERNAERFAAWNARADQWANNLTACEAAHNVGLFSIHSADGCCTRLDCDTHGLCRAIAEAHRGNRYDSPEFTADSKRASWDSVWPVIDADGKLTGTISEGEDEMLSVDDAAMIAADDAMAAGWRIDADEGTAAAPRLMDYHTRKDIRAATAEEVAASRAAGPEGVILVAADGSILRADDAGADDAQRAYAE
ncbi:hypothetical protein UFOVP1124_5 [uncultured Caudovirales phage]|uniref:Uncharacterized protein n=1 Tax=uncultured Caudovirales phage TaxID=2100421 RepID=A0A6J5QU72_9CAUD|nr:hypothetical protein UFOVP1124_5 [uncultured Caudovirales phage]